MAQYVHGHHDSVVDSHRLRTAANSAAYLLGELKPGHRLLDVGAGPGTITADLADVVGPENAAAMEVNDEALELTRRGLLDRGLTQVQLFAGDAHAVPAQDASFDVVHAHQVLQHISDPVRALADWGRLLTPGGLVAARDADYEAFTWYPYVSELDEWLELYRQLARATGGEPDAGRRLHSWAREAGYSDVRASASVWCYTTDEERGTWANTWANRVRHSEFATRALSSGLATQEDLDRIARGWLTWAQDPGGWFLIPHGEILAFG